MRVLSARDLLDVDPFPGRIATAAGPVAASVGGGVEDPFFALVAIHEVPAVDPAVAPGGHLRDKGLSAHRGRLIITYKED